MPIHRAIPSAILLLLLSACAGPKVADVFDEYSPPPDLGRPAWVRVPARIGAYAGALVGGVVSIVLLPVTYPVSLLGDDAFGKSRTDFLLFPAFIGAGAGHFLFGAPTDLIHYVGYRAWVEEPPAVGYDLVPEPPAQRDPLQKTQTRPAETRSATHPGGE